MKFHVELSVSKDNNANCQPPIQWNNRFLDKNADWVPQKLSDLAGLPLIIILPGQINEFDLTDYPRFSTVDSRLILNNYFTRSDLEREFLLATSFSKVNQTGRSPPDGAGERTSDEIDAAHALQGMKRKGDEHSGDVTPDKRIKMETDDDVIDPNSYQPTRIILSSEAFALFQGKFSPEPCLKFRCPAEIESQT